MNENIIGQLSYRDMIDWCIKIFRTGTPSAHISVGNTQRV